MVNQEPDKMPSVYKNKRLYPNRSSGRIANPEHQSSEYGRLTNRQSSVHCQFAIPQSGHHCRVLSNYDVFADSISDARKGWYINIDYQEKIMTESVTFEEVIYCNTYLPSDEISASGNPFDQIMEEDWLP